MNRGNRVHKTGIAVIGVVLVSYASFSQASTDTATFSVTASIVDACDVQATNQAFGAYSAASGTAPYAFVVGLGWPTACLARFWQRRPRCASV